MRDNHRSMALHDRIESVGARGSTRKLAASVSGRVVADIAAVGWPEGVVLGSENELLEKYHVSRAVFREAVRLLEHQGVARMRRGPGGGLVVMAPTVESVFDATMVYLLFVGAGLDEVLEARLILEEAAAELAAERLTEEGIDRLRGLVERERDGEPINPRDVHDLIATVAANPALELFVELLTRVALVYSPDAPDAYRDLASEVCGAHSKIVESIIGGEGGQAAGRMRRHLQAEADFIDKYMPMHPRLEAVFTGSPGPSKLAENVARRLFTGVMTDGWVIGRPLGSEPELMAKFGVSRAILREAARVLEHHQIAAMRRGPGGGLFVTEPGLDATSEAMAIYLDRRGIEPAHLFEVRSIVEMAVLGRVIRRRDDDVATTLNKVHAAELAAPLESFPVTGHDFHIVLANLSGNRVLALFTDVLVRLSRSHGAMPADAAGPLPTAEVIDVHERIIDAIIAGDVDLARHRMRHHLTALTRWVR